jgi:hypothetical protein
MRRLALAASLAVGVLFAVSNSASATSSADQLIAQWSEINSKCRGGSGDNPKTWEACDARDTLSSKLEELGYSYGCEGQAGYESYWRNDCGSLASHPVMKGAYDSNVDVNVEIDGAGSLIVVTSLRDEITVQRVTINRGNCSSQGFLTHRLPHRLLFGQGSVAISILCDVREVEVVTDLGPELFTFK